MDLKVKLEEAKVIEETLREKLEEKESMKRMKILGRSLRQLITMISEDMYQLEGLLCPGTKVFSLVCVMLAIIMDIQI